MRSKGSPTELEHRRQLAIQRSNEGYSADEIAEFLGISPRTVWRWLASFRDRGPAGLAARPIPGRPRKLDLLQEKIALRWLRSSPTEHGFATELWTAARLAQLIEEEFAIRFNPRSLSTWLRDRGFSPQKPERVPRERDPGAIAAWLASDWPRIKKKARRQGAHIALIDESGLMMAPLLRRTWAPRGQTPSLVQAGAHRKKVSVAAALWLSPRRDHLGLYFHTLADGYFDNWYMTAFLEAMLRQETQSKIINSGIVIARSYSERVTSGLFGAGGIVYIAGLATFLQIGGCQKTVLDSSPWIFAYTTRIKLNGFLNGIRIIRSMTNR